MNKIVKVSNIYTEVQVKENKKNALKEILSQTSVIDALKKLSTQ
ncbi:hypothetical protein [Companilactobacillus keshanensis]|uniref:Uncharacterized protein n=1 Tax=Companilactobacillus keshanensis TaxID=2486003 RepID=A0ABW4BUE2_9LACO|nr:hypothetical protein [Companilactobacillus keshanensis]